MNLKNTCLNQTVGRSCKINRRFKNSKYNLLVKSKVKECLKFHVNI